MNVHIKSKCQLNLENYMRQIEKKTMKHIFAYNIGIRIHGSIVLWLFLQECEIRIFNVVLT